MTHRDLASASPTRGKRLGNYTEHMQILRLLRGAFAALGIAAGVAGALRLRGSGGVPPRSGGWRELTGDELE